MALPHKPSKFQLWENQVALGHPAPQLKLTYFPRDIALDILLALGGAASSVRRLYANSSSTALPLPLLVT
jgi:hypothetical protein